MTFASRRASFEPFHGRAEAGKRSNVISFGGSLTREANASDPQLTSYRALMSAYLRERYPRASFAFFDAAIGGTGSVLGVFRIERDVLSRKPDLVFLDFTVNDDIRGTSAAPLAGYEAILRILITNGVAVEQVFLGFKDNVADGWSPESLHRLTAHKQLGNAYQTATADVIAYVQAQLSGGGISGGGVSVKEIWPFDMAHPADAGYRFFFESVRDGFELAVLEKRVCKIPGTPVFSDSFTTPRRIRLVEAGLPAGWKRLPPYREAMWFDGLSSRWIDDVACCDSSGGAALSIEFERIFVGLFGEGDECGLSFRVLIDGQLRSPPARVVACVAARVAASDPTLWTWRPPRGPGKLFVHRVIAEDLPPGKHVLKIEPVADPSNPRGQLRFESVCIAGATDH